ncbi:hypothetical protein ACJ41O_014215 [Fusarium nematophilum]
MARHSFTAQSGNTYSFTHIPSPNPTLLLLHGFPSTSSDFLPQTRHFSLQGHGILAPDLLGYGVSSKPSDVNSYRLKFMSDDLVELLDHLDLQKVVGIGHDFGATLLSRAAAYHPDRFMALVFLSVGPPRLGTPFDVGLINRMTKEALGFEMLGYIPWIADLSSHPVLEDHAEAAMSLMFCRDRQAWDEWFHPLGKMKQFVTEDRRLPIGEWYTEELQREHLREFGVRDGYKGASRWYRMWTDNLFAEDEVGLESAQLLQPSLFIAQGDSTLQQQMLSSWTPNLQTTILNTGHWPHLEDPAATNTAIQDFLSSL